MADITINVTELARRGVPDLEGGFSVPKSIADSLTDPKLNYREWPEIKINLTTGERKPTGRTFSLRDLISAMCEESTK